VRTDLLGDTLERIEHREKQQTALEATESFYKKLNRIAKRM
jgi:hypothetical protein